MNIQHFEKGFHYNDRELIIVARKLGKLATYCRQVKDAASFIRVDAERQASKKERDQLLVAVTVNLPGKRLFSDSRRNDVIEALDRCIEKLEPQVKRYKEMGTVRSKARHARK
ncbi:MAG: HPF/RaiA family ribosome-associated protein [Candidatus Peribacteraceae bacterium]|nr:HPF/RaiA family ribosome-associated protein [Candidatus Peribacteraceae bacterium]MDD5074844.1 HPF/RaiA family ribosome-associated protein [Candidatus Peribacteraceae bacterium]